ncbi:hypothetical protein BDR26DRAFT_896876 [Obelidium mucronatum]|nr:hypothetical protein BDR26DRAFT_896876 [Obelidium mucronatum]
MKIQQCYRARDAPHAPGLLFTFPSFKNHLKDIASMGAQPKLAADGVTVLPPAKLNNSDWEVSDAVRLLALIKETPDLTGSIARGLDPQRLAKFPAGILKSKIGACLKRLKVKQHSNHSKLTLDWDPMVDNAPVNLSSAKRRKVVTDDDLDDEKEDSPEALIARNERKVLSGTQLTPAEVKEDAAAFQAAFYNNLAKKNAKKAAKPTWDKPAVKPSHSQKPPSMPPAYTPKKPDSVPSKSRDDLELDMGDNLWPRFRQVGPGIPLHDLAFFKEEGKFYYLVFIYNADGMTVTFNNPPDGKTLECVYTPTTKPTTFYCDKNFPVQSMRNKAVYQYFANPQQEQFKYYIQFPNAVESSPSGDPHILTEKVALSGVPFHCQTGDPVTIVTDRPGGMVLTYRVADQKSEIVFGGFGTVILDKD